MSALVTGMPLENFALSRMLYVTVICCLPSATFASFAPPFSRVGVVFARRGWYTFSWSRTVRPWFRVTYTFVCTCMLEIGLKSVSGS